MLKKLVVLCALVLPLVAGCAKTDPGVRPHDRRILHQHEIACGHYFHDGRWYYVHNHLHQVGCGHYYYSGRWNLNPPTPGFTTHVELCPVRETETPSQAQPESSQHPRQRGYHTYYK